MKLSVKYVTYCSWRILPGILKFIIRRIFWLFFQIRWEFLRKPPYKIKYYGYNVVYMPGDSLISRFWKGYEYEPDVLACVLRILPPDAVFFDVGANIGLFTVAVARNCPASRIHCFEPSPTPRQCLHQTIIQNELIDRITLNEMALSSKSGVSEFFIHDDLRHASGDGFKDTGIAGATHTIRVPVTTLDNYVQETKIDRLDLIKIDTEGMELNVLRGGLNSIATLRPKIIFEAIPSFAAMYGISMEDIFMFLKNHNYCLQMLQGDVLDRVSFLEINSSGVSNFLAIPFSK